MKQVDKEEGSTRPNITVHVGLKLAGMIGCKSPGEDKIP